MRLKPVVTLQNGFRSILLHFLPVALTSGVSALGFMQGFIPGGFQWLGQTFGFIQFLLETANFFAASKSPRPPRRDISLMSLFHPVTFHFNSSALSAS